VDTVENPNNSLVNNPKIWEETKAKLKISLGESIFNAWISQIRLGTSSGNIVILEVPDAFFKDWVCEHYKDLILKSLKELSSQIEGVDLKINPELLTIQDDSRLEKYQTQVQKKT